MTPLILNFFLLCLVVGVDYATGSQVRLGSLYLLVAVIASWNLRPNALVFQVPAIAAGWCLAEWMTGVRYFETWIYCWNALNHLGAIGITVGIVCQARATMDRQSYLIHELRQSLLAVSRFKELVPVCPICNRVHLDAEYDTTVGEVVQESAEIESIGTVCSLCLNVRAERIARISVDSYFRTGTS